MIYRVLQASVLACMAVGLWRHDWILIVASASLVLCWWLISEDVRAA